MVEEETLIHLVVLVGADLTTLVADSAVLIAKLATLVVSDPDLSDGVRCTKWTGRQRNNARGLW